MIFQGKKYLSILLLISTLFSVNIPVLAEQTNEKIYNEIMVLKEGEYESTQETQTFTMLDLKAYVTRNFKDDVEGDRTGGWSDQGTNDCRDFTYRGVNEFMNIPFNIIEPDENDGKSVIVLRGQSDAGIPSMVEVPVGKTAAGAYFLHTSAYAMGEGVKEAEYTFVYADGTSATMDIYDQEQVRDFWGTGDYETCLTAWSANRAVDNRLVSVSLFALNNPYPDKIIDKIRLETVENGGLAYIMILGITLTSEGPYLPDKGLGDKINPSTMNWLVHDRQDTVVSGSPLDSSFLLDKPAGKYGRVIKKDDEFAFENGEKVKFWGTNLSLNDAFLNKETTAKIAGDIAMCGYNIVRFNDVDIYELTEEKTDALFYMISQLKERGIYTYLPLKIKSNIKDFVNKNSINEQKSVIEAFMNKKNPYTNLMVKEEPAIAMVELLSGTGLLGYTSGFERNFFVEDDKIVLEQEFNKWLLARYGDNNKLKNAWTGDGIGINEGESLESQNISIPGWWRHSLYTEERKLDTQRFLAEKQQNYYNEMKEFLVELGYTGMASCSSNEVLYPQNADGYANRKADFIAKNVVWNEPFGSPYIDSFAWIRDDGSMLGDENLGFFHEIAASAYADAPMVISEWSEPMCNVYSAEGFVMMSIFAGKQDWNAINYTYMLDVPTDINKLTDYYSVYKNPSFKALATACSRVFHNTDAFQNENLFKINDAAVLGQKVKMPKWDIVSGKHRLAYDETVRVLADDTSYNQYVCEDFSINYIDDRMMVENDFVFAFTGKGMGVIKSNLLTAEIEDEEAAIILTSNDGKALKTSDSLLLTVVGNSRNKGLSYVKENVSSSGFETILSEVKYCKFNVALDGDYDIYSLDSKGERKSKIGSYKNSEGELVFSINDKRWGSDKKSLNFEIVRRG